MLSLIHIWAIKVINSSIMCPLADGAALLQNGPNGVGGLRAVLHPILGPLHVDLDVGGIGERVIIPNFLDEPAIPGGAAVRHHNPDVYKRQR